MGSPQGRKRTLVGGSQIEKCGIDAELCRGSAQPALPKSQDLGNCSCLHCSSTGYCVAIPLQYVGVAWWGATGLVLVTRLLGRWLYCSSALGRSANSAQSPRHNIQTGSIQSGTCLYKNILCTDYYKAVLLSCQYIILSYLISWSICLRAQ